MIKALLVPTLGQEGRLLKLLRLSDLFEKHGLAFVTTGYDAVLLTHTRFSDCEPMPAEDVHLDLFKAPVILLERADGAKVHTAPRYLREPRVKALFKKALLRPLALNNASSCSRHHYALIRTAMDGRETEPLARGERWSATDLRKLRSVPWELNTSFFNPRFQDMARQPIDLRAERPVDVCFCGRAQIYHPEYRWHRQRAVDVIDSLQGMATVTVGTGDPGEAFRYLTLARYDQLTGQAKVVVSPWGLGEYCHRDVEAILGGAVLVKPLSDFVDMVPPIYTQNETYVPCQPDFSDLEDILPEIVANFDCYLEMRRYTRAVLERWNYERYVRHFVIAVEQALDGS